MKVPPIEVWVAQMVRYVHTHAAVVECDVRSAYFENELWIFLEHERLFGRPSLARMMGIRTQCITAKVDLDQTEINFMCMTRGLPHGVIGPLIVSDAIAFADSTEEEWALVRVDRIVGAVPPRTFRTVDDLSEHLKTLANAEVGWFKVETGDPPSHNLAVNLRFLCLEKLEKSYEYAT